ncbi:MAG: GNAT family N-acetyltransferase [Sedimentibacter sp.]
MQLCLSNGGLIEHKGTVVLKTERFILRQFKLSDVHDVYVNWSSDKDSAKYNAWSVHENENETKAYVSEWVEHYKKANYYHWAIIDKDNDEVIGSISVSNIKNRKKYCEIGYTVAKKRWNEGIATEVLKCVIEFLTIYVGFEKLRAMHDVRNKASGRVMEKADMIFVKNQLKVFLSGRNFIMNCSIYEYKKQ